MMNSTESNICRDYTELLENHSALGFLSAVYYQNPQLKQVFSQTTLFKNRNCMCIMRLFGIPILPLPSQTHNFIFSYT